MREKISKLLDYLLETVWILIIIIIPAIFSYWPVTYNLVDLPKAAAFIILIEIAAIVFCLKILLEGKISISIFKNKILLLLGFIFICNIVSVILSIHPQRSLFGEYTRQNGFFFFIHLLLFFAIIILNLKNWSQVRRIIISVLISSAVVCAFGILQSFNLGITEWQKIAFRAVDGRIYSSFGQPNFFGHYLIMIIPLTFYSLFFLFKKNISKILVSALLLLQILSLLLTFSRSAWLGFIFEIFLFLALILLFYRKKIFKRELVYKYYLPLFLLFIIILSFNLFFKSGKPGSENFFSGRFKSITDLKSGSVKLRLFYWQAAINEIKQMKAKNILFGYGQENISDVFARHYKPEWGIYEQINSYPDRSHNSLFDIIFTTGIFGFLAVASFYLYIIISAVRFIKKSEIRNKNDWLVISILIILGGYFINNLFSFSVITNYVYLYLFLAILIFIVFKGQEKIIYFYAPKFFSLLLFLTITSSLSIFSYLYAVKPVIADYYLMKMDKARVSNNCQGILDNLKLVVKWQPSNIYYQDMYVYNGLNCITKENDVNTNLAIKNNILGVIELMDGKERYYKTDLNIARAYALFGFYFDGKFPNDYYKIADNEYEKLFKLNPNFTNIYIDWGRMKLWQGKNDEAIVIFKKGLEIMPYLNDPYLNMDHKKSIEQELIALYYNLGEAYHNKKDWENAIINYNQALKLNPYYLDVYKKLADTYRQTGNFDKAIWYNKRGVNFKSQ
jgi:putative inorganic carbon (HCO3(-)) transporter